MPTESHSYVVHNVKCPSCEECTRCRTLPVIRPTVLFLVCPNCRQDIVIACLPDEFLDNTRQTNGMFEVALIDLIYLEGLFTEEEGDRILWGQRYTMEQRINEHLAGKSNSTLSSAESAT